MSTPLTLLTHWLERDCAGDLEWFSQQRTRIDSEGYRARAFYTAIGLIPRKLGKSDLALTPKDVQNASATIEGWDPTDYSVDMVADPALCR